MLDSMFKSIIAAEGTTVAVSIQNFLICTIVSIILGIIIAVGYMHGNQYTQSFVITLALLPAIVQVVIMLVNGNLGTGVAVMGAFSLVRFRSAPGNAKEIGSIFLAMAVGLGTGMGYIGISLVFVIILTLTNMFFSAIKFGEPRKVLKELKITIPEDLDYNGMFEDLFNTYTRKAELIQVKTTNMGSLFQLLYFIQLKDQSQEKELIDLVRCRNGNLDIVCGKVAYGKGEL